MLALFTLLLDDNDIFTTFNDIWHMTYDNDIVTTFNIIHVWESGVYVVCMSCNNTCMLMTMCVCICVCVYVYMHVCMYVCGCVCVLYNHIYTYTCKDKHCLLSCPGLHIHSITHYHHHNRLHNWGVIWFVSVNKQ